jgi:hypothetical protein
MCPLKILHNQENQTLSILKSCQSWYKKQDLPSIGTRLAYTKPQGGCLLCFVR